MSIYKKLAEARVKLQESKITKSGLNKFAGFKYYELADFLPTLNKINFELGICTKFEIKNNNAFLTVFDTEKQDDCIIFNVPYVQSKIKGATEIQELGGSITYLRRYLLLIAFEITDGDVVDAQNPKDNEKVEDTKNKEKAIKMIFSLIKEEDDDALTAQLEYYKRKDLGECTEEELKKIYKYFKDMKK